VVGVRKIPVPGVVSALLYVWVLLVLYVPTMRLTMIRMIETYPKDAGRVVTILFGLLSASASSSSVKNDPLASSATTSSTRDSSVVGIGVLMFAIQKQDRCK